jgi:hypothetical protein
MLRRITLGLALAAAPLTSPPATAAHGPCSCTWPVVVSPGGVFRTGSGYKAIWNPRPADFANETTPIGLASGHRPDAPTRSALQGSRSHPRRRMVVRVPRATPPGIYLVLVFDGSEAGGHTTWDYVQVPGRPAGAPATATATRRMSPETARRSRPRGLETAIIAAAVGIVVGTHLKRRRRSRRRRC